MKLWPNRKGGTIFKYVSFRCIVYGCMTLGISWIILRARSYFQQVKFPVNTQAFARMATPPSMKERFEAAMVLSGAGDAIGYKNGQWEFCHSGEAIHEELKKNFGNSVDNIKVDKRKWPVSDDTVMHIATATALVEFPEPGPKLYQKLAKEYKECMHDMTGRAPGNTCMDGAHKLRPMREDGYIIPFNPRGGGCGAAMRAMCIGLLYSDPKDIDKLIAVSVESGRMTHNHPTGYLGALAAALFTAYSIQEKPVIEWGKGLVDTLPDALKYVQMQKRDVKANEKEWGYFGEKWQAYLKIRGIEDGKSEPTFPNQYNIKDRDAFYKSLSFSGWGGSSGHDAPMIAYDALLSYNGTWQDLCSRAMFHSGDSDSTAVIAGSCYGAMYGYKGVHENNYKDLEYKAKLQKLAQKIYVIRFPQEKDIKAKIEEEEKEEERVLENIPEVPEGDEPAKIKLERKPTFDDEGKEVEPTLADIEERAKELKSGEQK